jgi:Holliday junction resolvase RusA-like endonuclease
VIHIVVPLIPPSVNHYKMRTRKGVTFVSREAKSFKEAVAICSRGLSADGEFFRVYIGIFLGKGGKGDVDNFAKCCLDGLVDAGVIHSDAAITSLTIEKSRDVANPRTEITVEAL